jgi:hypothetical protein
MVIEDDKLRDDVIRRKYSDSHHALCCLECGFESAFDQTAKPSIMLVEHNCKKNGD